MIAKTCATVPQPRRHSLQQRGSNQAHVQARILYIPDPRTTQRHERFAIALTTTQRAGKWEGARARVTGGADGNTLSYGTGREYNRAKCVHSVGSPRQQSRPPLGFEPSLMAGGERSRCVCTMHNAWGKGGFTLDTSWKGPASRCEGPTLLIEPDVHGWGRGTRRSSGQGGRRPLPLRECWPTQTRLPDARQRSRSGTRRGKRTPDLTAAEGRRSYSSVEPCPVGGRNVRHRVALPSLPLRGARASAVAPWARDTCCTQQHRMNSKACRSGVSASERRRSGDSDASRSPNVPSFSLSYGSGPPASRWLSLSSTHGARAEPSHGGN
jgi:hypothetical protein